MLAVTIGKERTHTHTSSDYPRDLAHNTRTHDNLVSSGFRKKTTHSHTKSLAPHVTLARYVIAEKREPESIFRRRTVTRDLRAAMSIMRIISRDFARFPLDVVATQNETKGKREEKQKSIPSAG